MSRKPTRQGTISFLLLWGAVLCCVHLQAQAVRYAYDVAGNRVVREKVITLLRSEGVDEKEKPEAAPDTASSPFEDELMKMQIKIYPNPTKGFLRIDIAGKGKLPKDAQIALYGMNGKLIRRMTGITSSNSLDISDQPAGTYVMYIAIDKDNASSWKIIKE